MGNHHHEHKEYFKIDFIRETIGRTEDFETVSDIFSLMGDSTRLKIYWILCHSKECVVNISEILGMTTPAVSHHLKLLKDAELIESYRDGKEVFYTISSNSKSKIMHEIIEELMSMNCPDFDNDHEKINEKSEYLEDQISIIKRVHDYLIHNLSSRITIEELSKEFGINPTTLKTVFKDVYGDSLAAHIKEHRMEAAAQLLVNSEASINEVAANVGYESQSKFTAVFKEFYGCTPVEYRRKKHN